MDGGRLTGYLLGSPKSSPVWGPNLWVEAAGKAVEEAETMRDLYAVAAARWVEEGRTAQYVVVPATTRIWSTRGSGSGSASSTRMRSTRCLRATAGTGRADHTACTRDDIDVLAELDLALPEHQGQSPVFSAGELPTLEEARADWEEDIDDVEYANFVAEHDGRVIGSAVGCALEKSSAHSGLARPDNAGFLGYAAVLPEARGLGAGRASVRRWSGGRRRPGTTEW